MLIELISPSRFRISGKEAKAWRKKMGRFKPGYKYTGAYKKKRWDGKVYPGRIRGGRLVLRRGLLNRVAADFPGSTIRPLFDVSQVPTPFIQGAEMEAWDKLFDYQKVGVDIGLKKKWGQIAMATNAGKGAIIALLAKSVANAGGRALILCDEISVYGALMGEVMKWGNIKPGEVSAGVDYPPEDQIVIAMLPTLHGRVHPLCPNRNESKHKRSCDLCSGGYMTDKEWLEWVQTFNMLLADEADKATADTWMRILKDAENTTWRLGFSGTFPEPDSYDGFILEEHLGPVLTEVRNAELIDRGISAKPLVELLPYKHHVDLPRDWRDMRPPQRRQFLYEQEIVYNRARNEFVAGLVESGKPTAIIINRIDHGYELEKLIPGSVYLKGEDTKAEREEVLEQFRAAEVPVLIATKILDRGTNLLGTARTLIFASAEGSDRQTLQRIGRGLRKSEGKERIRIKDVIDSGHDYLNRAARKRVELYNDEGFDVRVNRG